MPLPQTVLPLQSNEVSHAIDSALTKLGVAEPNKDVVQALNAHGATIEQLTAGLVNLTYTAKDNIKHAAIKDALRLHGVRFNDEGPVGQTPTFVFNIQTDTANIQPNLNQLFAPER